MPNVELQEDPLRHPEETLSQVASFGTIGCGIVLQLTASTPYVTQEFVGFGQILYPYHQSGITPFPKGKFQFKPKK